MRLLVENYLSAEASLGGAGADETRWPYPVRSGEHAACSGHGGRVQTIVAKPDRGIIRS